MEDTGIIDLYWARDERAVEETERKYGGYCRSISYHILKNRQDAEECVNDAYVRAWNRYRWNTARRRSGQVPLVLEELADATAHSPEQALEQAELGRLLDKFLRSLPQKDCCIFLRRYWYMDPLEEIARRYRMPLGSVKSSLYRSRKKLRTYLEQKGVIR